MLERALSYVGKNSCNNFPLSEIKARYVDCYSWAFEEQYVPRELAHVALRAFGRGKFKLTAAVVGKVYARRGTPSFCAGAMPGDLLVMLIVLVCRSNLRKHAIFSSDGAQNNTATSLF